MGFRQFNDKAAAWNPIGRERLLQKCDKRLIHNLQITDIDRQTEFRHDFEDLPAGAQRLNDNPFAYRNDQAGLLQYGDKFCRRDILILILPAEEDLAAEDLARFGDHLRLDCDAEALKHVVDAGVERHTDIGAVLIPP